MTVKTPIYLDCNATTPLDPRVLEAMMPYLTGEFGNAASVTHAYGDRARQAVEAAREQLGRLIGAPSPDKEIVWTSGATEANNLALKGVAEMYRDKGNHIVTAATEHKAVLDVVAHLGKTGYDVTVLDVDGNGQVHPEQVAEAITDRTILVSLMLANNETGVLHPLADVGRVCKERGVLLHTDATQAVGKIPVSVDALGVDLLSCSGHKLYGPKGVGALWLRRRSPRVRLAIQMHGGGHEANRRSGTLNVPGIVGFGAAAELGRAEMPEQSRRVGALRDRLEQGLMGRLENVRRNGHPTDRLPNTSNLSFGHVEGEAFMHYCQGIAVSSGSACTSASLEPSYVLAAMGLPPGWAHASIRFSLGRFTTAEEVDYTVEHAAEAVQRVRDISQIDELNEVFGR